MPTDYRLRLKLASNLIDDGHESMLLLTLGGLAVSVGFTRVVIGGRGPYMEFNREQIIEASLRWERAGAFYTEYRTIDVCNVKVYHQIATVDYADYRPDMWYISPFELTREDGTTLIDPLRRTGRRV